MRIGLFGGTFDPPHIAHIALAENILQNGDIDEIWFLVTPQNPWKTSNQLTLDAHRLEMVKLCTEGLNGLIVSDYEYHLSKPTYSYQTLRSLRSNYPNHSFCLLVGGDNWEAFDHWREYEEILRHHKIIVYPRPESRLVTSEGVEDFYKENPSAPGFTTVEAPLYNISSTMIRERILKHEDTSEFLPRKVQEYIEHHHLYVSPKE